MSYSSLERVSSSFTNALRTHPTSSALAAAAVVGIAAYVFTHGGVYAAADRLKRWYRAGLSGAQPGVKEAKVLKQVFSRAAEGNPQSVLAVMDDFCWKSQWMMAIGDVKGKILEREVKNRQPKVAVEFGGYCGYSAVLIAASLPPDGHLYSLEIDPLYAAISTKIVEFAGLRDKVTVVVGSAAEKLSTLKSQYKVSAIDLLFIDHVKSLYLQDFKLVEQLNLLPPGAVIVGDNILYPGAPDFLAYVQNNPHYKTTLHHTVLEYQHDKKDIVTVSVRL